MDRVGTLLKSWAQQRNEDDFVDRLHYKVTTMLLTSCAFMIFAKEYGGQPIRCWSSGEWTGSWVEYAHDICFVENTYYVPLQDGIKASKYKHREINYYQWVPFFLLGQALLYNLPSLFWSGLNWTSGECKKRALIVSGLHVRAIVSMTSNAVGGLELDGGAKRKLAEFIHNTLNYRAGKQQNMNLLRRMCCLFNMFQGGSCRLAVLYYVKKLLFLITSFYQLVLLSRFLGHSSSFWGFNTIQKLRSGQNWQDTGIFPRVTMCDFSVREHDGPARNVTVQCVLMANMINEKIFLGLWCWICILLAITVVNLLQWWSGLSSQSNRASFVFNSLLAGHSVCKFAAEPRPTADLAHDFTEFLTVDGVLLFKLIEINSSCLISNDVMYEVYRVHFGLDDSNRKGDQKSDPALPASS